MSPLVDLSIRGLEVERMQYSEELKAKVIERALGGSGTQDAVLRRSQEWTRLRSREVIHRVHTSW